MTPVNSMNNKINTALIIILGSVEIILFLSGLIIENKTSFMLSIYLGVGSSMILLMMGIMNVYIMRKANGFKNSDFKQVTLYECRTADFSVIEDDPQTRQHLDD